MKRTTILFLLSVLCTAWATADTLTLNLTDLLPYYQQTAGGFWEDTYVPGTIEDSLFRFAHTGSSDGGGGMAYWEGFTLCTSGDTTNYGAEGSSDGWISNQWGCMAGGGVNAQGQAVTGAPYLVGYWGFFQEQLTPGYHSLRIDFADEQAHQPVGVWICNHPWPYYGNINGDGFASAFTQEGDYFALVAHGLNAQGEPTGVTARLMLATFSDGALLQSKDWQYMDLRALGTVNGLFFTMETSDVDALYGANTAVYFCMDRLSVLSVDTLGSSLERPSGLQVTAAGEDSLCLSWSAVADATGYRLWLDSTSVGTTTDTTFIFRGLEPFTSYSLSVVAMNATDTSDVASITGQTTDETAPSVPANLQAEPAARSITITWSASEDKVGIKRYTVFLDGQAYKRTTTCTCTIVGLDPATEYLLEVEAEDLAGNKSGRASLRAKTLTDSALDITPEDNNAEAFFTLDGRYLGTERPESAGTYIIKNKQKTNIIVIVK